MSGRVDSLLKNRNALFWTLHIGGWLAYGVSQYLGTLIYDYKKEHATGYLTVICVAAVGARQLTRMLYFPPSIASVCIKPTSAILAAP